MSPDTIIAATCKWGSITREDMIGRSRKAHVSHIRKIAMHLMRGHTKLSYPRIGQLFARDHSTVISADRSITRMRTDRRFDLALNAILPTIDAEDWRDEMVHSPTRSDTTFREVVDVVYEGCAA